MNMALQTNVKTVSTPVLVTTPVQNGLMQRKCSPCGIRDEEPWEEQKKRLTMQRNSTNQVQSSKVPPIVHEVLNSSGQPLDTGTRAFMEPRFRHDFSKVRVHTDSNASESARAVQSLAYTSGSDIVFGTGQYNPETIEGKRLLAHELTHVVQQSSQRKLQNKLTVGEYDDVFEKEADKLTSQIPEGKPNTHNISPVQQISGIIQRLAIHRGNILDEGDCEHLACNSVWACKDNNNGITCPKGTEHASDKEKYRPLFACDSKCEKNKTCSESDNWMAIPKSRFAFRKCNQHLVICANGKSTPAYVRDKSNKEAWEVSRGIQDKLGVSPYATFTGSIYGDESDKEVAKDTRCHTAKPPQKSEVKSPQTSDSGDI